VVAPGLLQGVPQACLECHQVYLTQASWQQEPHQAWVKGAPQALPQALPQASQPAWGKPLGPWWALVSQQQEA
jgi:hypothetical protein